MQTITSNLPWQSPAGTRPRFRDLFDVSPDTVIREAMLADGDVPDRAPAIALAIRSVSMRRGDVVLRVSDPLGGGEERLANCVLTVGAAVPSERSGLHVSRIGDAIAASARGVQPSLEEYTVVLAATIADREYGRASVAVDARLPRVEEMDPVGAAPAKRSLETLNLIVRTTVTDGEITTDAGLRVSHIVACPCVQETYKHVLRVRGIGAWAEELPLITHTQRCTTTVVAGGLRRPLPVAAVLGRLDGVLVLTKNTLPRHEELAMVYRAHRCPQFVEDASRAAVVALSRALDGPGACEYLDVTSRSVESIHEYDLEASLRLDATEVWAQASTILPPESVDD